MLPVSADFAAPIPVGSRKPPPSLFFVSLPQEYKYINPEYNFAALLPMFPEESRVHLYISCRLPPCCNSQAAKPAFFLATILLHTTVASHWLCMEISFISLLSVDTHSNHFLFLSLSFRLQKTKALTKYYFHTEYSGTYLC